VRGFIGDDTDYLFFPDDQQIRFALKNPRHPRHPRQEAEKCGSGRETGGERVFADSREGRTGVDPGLD
jgi:hypothetical protein